MASLPSQAAVPDLSIWGNGQNMTHQEPALPSRGRERAKQVGSLLIRLILEEQLRIRAILLVNALPHVNVSGVCQVSLHHGGRVWLPPISLTKTSGRQLRLFKVAELTTVTKVTQVAIRTAESTWEDRLVDSGWRTSGRSKIRSPSGSYRQMTTTILIMLQ
jgi:hypothetical protein